MSGQAAELQEPQLTNALISMSRSLQDMGMAEPFAQENFEALMSQASLSLKRFVLSLMTNTIEAAKQAVRALQQESSRLKELQDAAAKALARVDCMYCGVRGHKYNDCEACIQLFPAPGKERSKAAREKQKERKQVKAKEKSAKKAAEKKKKKKERKNKVPDGESAEAQAKKITLAAKGAIFGKGAFPDAKVNATTRDQVMAGHTATAAKFAKEHPQKAEHPQEVRDMSLAFEQFIFYAIQMQQDKEKKHDGRNMDLAEAIYIGLKADALIRKAERKAGEQQPSRVVPEGPRDSPPRVLQARAAQQPFFAVNRPRPAGHKDEMDEDKSEFQPEERVDRPLKKRDHKVKISKEPVLPQEKIHQGN